SFRKRVNSDIVVLLTAVGHSETVSSFPPRNLRRTCHIRVATILIQCPAFPWFGKASRYLWAVAPVRRAGLQRNRVGISRNYTAHLCIQTSGGVRDSFTFLTHHCWQFSVTG